MKDSDEEIHVVVVMGYHHIYFQSLDQENAYKRKWDIIFIWIYSISFFLFAFLFTGHIAVVVSVKTNNICFLVIGCPFKLIGCFLYDRLERRQWKCKICIFSFQKWTSIHFHTFSSRAWTKLFTIQLPNGTPEKLDSDLPRKLVALALLSETVGICDFGQKILISFRHEVSLLLIAFFPW